MATPRVPQQAPSAQPAAAVKQQQQQQEGRQSWRHSPRVPRPLLAAGQRRVGEVVVGCWVEEGQAAQQAEVVGPIVRSHPCTPGCHSPSAWEDAAARRCPALSSTAALAAALQAASTPHTAPSEAALVVAAVTKTQGVQTRQTAAPGRT